MSDRTPTYLFGPVERRGILGPLDADQALLLGGGGVGAVVVLDLSPSAGGVVLALGLLGLAVLSAVVPLAGRSPVAWAAVAVAYLLRTRLRAGHWESRLGAPLQGFSLTAVGAGRITWRAPRPVPPRALRGIRILAAEYRGRPVAALSERDGRRLTVVLACRVDAFALLDAETQARRLARWGTVLAAAAGTPVRRIAWVERAAPAPGDQLARWLHAERDPKVPLRGTPMIDSYLELISGGAQVVQEHEILLAVQVDGRGSGRQPDAALPDLLEHAERVAHGVEAAGVSVLGILGPGQIARLLRTGFDPFARAELASFDAADPARDGLAELSAWPVGVREHWDRLIADGSLHATFWISAWPRVEVTPMFLGPLLGRSGAVRTMAVVFEPVPIGRSTREVEAAVTRDLADRQLRARFGQSETARQRQLATTTRRREAELAAGHAEVRLAGYITVSARDEAELRRACADVTEHAARARLELHRLYGHQAEAFAFTLPLCRGLR